MESATEVRYAGVVLGRATELRDASVSGAFVVLPEPLPVGTPIVLKTEEGERSARVIEVIESADPAVAGMRVRFMEGGEARAAAIVTKDPAPAVSPPSAPSAPPDPPSAPPEAPSAGSPSPQGDPSDGAGRRRRRRR
jgi:hypothetical protein